MGPSDLDSLLSLHPDVQMNDYTMGLPLFPTPMTAATSSPPHELMASPSTSTSSAHSLSTPSLSSFSSTPHHHNHHHNYSQQQSSYRITKPAGRSGKSKPGPKPKNKFSPPRSDSSSTSPPSSSLLLLAGGAGLEDENSPEVLDKRYRNNIAAKKYRQKKVDRISELESALADMTRERDELRLLLARKEAEGQVLREVMARTGKDEK